MISANVPSVAVLPKPESVRESMTIRNWALRDAIDSVHLSGIELTDAVPVDSGAILLHLVCDMNDNLISPASLKRH